MQEQKPRVGYKFVNTFFDFIEEAPEDWEIKSIGSFATEINTRFSEEKDGPVLSVTKHRGFVKSLDYFKKQIFSKDIKKYKLVEKGDFAYATIHIDEGSIGILREFPYGYVSPMYTVFRIDSSVDPEYLYLLLKTDSYLQKFSAMGQGTVDRRRAVSFEKLSNLKIPLPTLEEQKEISSIISDIDLLIQKTQNIIAKTLELKQGLTQTLLTKGIDHTKFKLTKLGEIPESWSVMKCNDVCKEITVGIVTKPASMYVDSGIPCFRSLNILEDDINENDFVYISKESSEKHSKSELREGDVLIVRTGYPGTSCTVPKKYEGSNCIDLVIARVNDKITGKFLSRFFNSELGKKQILGTQGGLAQQHFNVGSARSSLIPVPPLTEQDKITDILSNVDSDIKMKKEYESKLQIIKKGLIQKFVSGELRIKI